jgi:hypothetical protein
MHIRNNLGLSEEQRSFFIMRAMTKFHQVVGGVMGVACPRGKKIALHVICRLVAACNNTLWSNVRVFHCMIMWPDPTHMKS